MRYIIYGAGAIGGAIGGRLFQAGYDVVLICRGAHLEVVQSNGLTLRTPDSSATLRIPAVGHPSEIDFRADDVVLLTMKSQHTADGLNALCASGGGDAPVICAQNGVANERMALRRFSRVYGMLVVLPATYLEPGEVLMPGTPVDGVLDAGCFPSGVDKLVEKVTADLDASGFRARPDEEIMRLKYAKLLSNLANAVQALCGLDAAAGDLVRLIRHEAIACYEAASIDYAPPTELRERASEVRDSPLVDPRARGGSTWQSLKRGSGSIETDYLNGEIALLGALHGVPTPFNRMLQRVMAEALREGRAPGSYTPEDLIRRAEAGTPAAP